MNNEMDSFNIVCNTLSLNAHLSINKILIKKIGILPAIFLSDLISKHIYFVKNGMIDDEEYFFNTEKNRQEDTGLNPKQQRKCIEELKKLNYIDTKRKGVPAKVNFKILYSEIIEILKEKKGELEVPIGTTRSPDRDNKKSRSGELYNKNNNKNKLIRIKKEKNKKESGEGKNNSSLNSKNKIPHFSDSLKNLPPEFLHSPEFILIWKEWFQYRTEIKKKLSPTSIKKQIKFFSSLSVSNSIEIINRSIRNGWTGLFPLDRENKAPSNLYTQKGKEQEEFVQALKDKETRDLKKSKKLRERREME